MTNMPSKFITSYYFKCTYCGKVSYSNTFESPSMCGRCSHKTSYHNVKGDKQKINPEYIRYLEKENAELKERSQILNLNGNIAIRDLNDRLTKAKEIIKSLLNLWNDVMTEEAVEALIAKAEQFLKESEG